MKASGAPNKRWLLRQISLFTSLTESQIELVAAHCRIAEYAKEEFIYRQGDPADAFYGLVSGRVRVFVRHGSENQETLEVLHPGDYFGTISILTNEPHSVTTQAINDSILIKIKRPDFEMLLKQIPEMAIHLSTTLSRRLRQKDLPAKRVFESTLISIYSPVKGSGRTMYGINLACSLHKETAKRVILVDLNPGGEAVYQALGVGQFPPAVRLKAGGFDQAQVAASIVRHEAIGLDTLNVAHEPHAFSDVGQITPLLSYLANLYPFVLTDLPHQMDRTIFKALVQADLIHLLCDGTREHLEATAAVITELKRTIQQAENRLRIIVNETSQDVDEHQRGELLQHRVYATLPAVNAPPAPGHPVVLAHPDWEYGRAIRRIGREIGKVLVGLVLGSGAAMGLAHIGVLKVLEREGIPIDIVAGSSIGALLGAFWAAGFSPAALEKLAAEFRTKGSLLKLVDPPFPGPKFGILVGGQITKFLYKHLGDKTFRDLKVPVKITAVDYARRELVVMDEGSVVKAIRASVSIPAIFYPVKVRGRWLIDGGVLDPVPVDVLNRMGVHKVIAVNTLPSPEDITRRHQELAEERIRLSREASAKGWGAMLSFRVRRQFWGWMDTNIFDVIMHTMQGMEYVLAEAQCAQADVALHPTIPRVNWWEFYNVEQLIRRGEEETEAHLPEIKKLVFE
jgi:NTE family protein